MPKIPKISTPALVGYDDIFSADGQNVQNAPTENHIIHIPLDDLHPPEVHPFQVRHDAAMERLVSSIKENGVLEPGLARPRACGDGYELISGNRRKLACSIAGLPTLPVIVRELDDDSAAIIMVDCNLEQRESILISEKAAAYKVKMDAMAHKGVKDEKQSVEILMEQTGESRSQIFRLLRITELIVDLQDKLDAKQLAFSPAIELSHLSVIEQKAVSEAMDSHGVKPSVSQAQRLKKLSQSKGLDVDGINEILSENKGGTKDNGNNGDKKAGANESEAEDKAATKYRQYFPPDFTPEQIDSIIVGLLRGWQSGTTIMPESA